MAYEEPSSAEAPPGWRRFAGRRATVLAPDGSFAAARAAVVVKEAGASIAALERLLQAGPRGGGDSVDIILVDGDAVTDEPAIGDDSGQSLTSSSSPPLIRVVTPERGLEPLAWPVTRVLVERWFGPRALAAEAMLRGLAGLVAAELGSGPSRAEADVWVQQRLRDGTLPSLFAPAPTTPANAADAAAPGAEHRAVDRLAVFDGARGRFIALRSAALTIGRDPDADVVLDDLGVSRRHATLISGPDGLWLRDEGSRNGVVVNGRTVRSARLTEGDRIRIGRYNLMLFNVEHVGWTARAELAATSFVAYVRDEFGARALCEFLSRSDPERQDRAAVAVFHSPLGALEERWVATMRQQALRGRHVRAFARQVGPLLAPYRWRLTELVVLMLLGTANTLALPLGFRYLVDHVLPSRQVRDLIVFTLVLGALFVVSNAIALRRVYVASKLSERMGVDLQGRMFHHLLSLSHSFYSNVQAGDLLSRFTRDLTIVQQALVSLTTGSVALVISALGAFATLLVLNVYVAAVVFGVVPLYALFHVLLHGRFHRLSYERQQQAGETVAVLQETLAAHDLIKAYGAEERALGAYRARLHRALRTAYRLVMTGAVLQASVGLISAVAQLGILAVGGYLVLEGDLTLGTLLAAIALAPSVLQPISQLSDAAQTAQAASGSMARIRELLDQPPEVADSPEAPALRAPANEIAFEAVTLAYGPGRPAIEDITLRIPVGSHVAFVGPSGAGKTSVLNLLLRFWDPTSGRVAVDGTDIRDVSLPSLRRHFGVILQDTFLFNTTVRANIAFGRPEATDEDVVAAATAAQLHDFIVSLPAGYDTVLGDRGVRLSGGQRQRISIARALLRDPAVLILDEATSALDARTETELRQSLEVASKGRTVISITHRLGSAMSADHIFVLAAGHLVEEGTHERLMATAGLYRQLWDEQGAMAGARSSAELEAAQALAAVPLLRRVPARALEALGRVASVERYGPGTDVVFSGAARLVVVVEGQLELGAEEAGSMRLGPGDFVGETSLVSDRGPDVPLRAVSAARVVALARPDYLAVAERYPELRREVASEAARRRAALTSAVSAGARFDTVVGT